MKKIILINAIVWAVLLIGSAFLFNDHPDYNYLFFGLIMASTITQTLLVDYNKKANKKCVE